MQYKLVLQNHVDGLSTRVWVFNPPTVIGRDPSADVCVEHDSISRKHCQFTLNSEGALTVKDLGSMNGTYVNDRKIQTAILMPGQVVQIGALMLQVEFTQESERHAPAVRPQGSVYATQPMETFRPVPLPPEKPWWKRILGG
ncbi:MAG: FHA domain-containing protein [Planctomycetales bacterium]|nr:FHA domain-containing protein [Planctomycetales bacterium]